MDIVVGLVVGGVVFFTILMLLLGSAANKRAKADRLARQKIREAEQKRLDDIRAAMTPAEWELYVVQLEILRVLRSQAKAASKGSGSGYSFGFSQVVD